MTDHDSRTPSPSLTKTDQWRARYALACALGNEVAEDIAARAAEPTDDVPAPTDLAELARREARAVLDAQLRARKATAAGPAADRRPAGIPHEVAAEDEAESILRPLILELVDAPSESSTAPEIERELAEAMVRPALLLLAGIWALTKVAADPRTDAVDIDDFREMTASGRSPRDLEERDDVQRLLDTRDHAGIIRFIGLAHMMNSTDAAYAGACYFAVAARDPDTTAAAQQMATDLLGFAITAPGLKEWAQEDPVLKPLAETDGWKALFPEKKPVYRSAATTSV